MLKKIISIEKAGQLLLLLLGLLAGLHLLILFGLVPASFVWGGRLTDSAELYRMEILALVILALMATIVCLRLGYFRFITHQGLIRGACWLLVVYFILNTLGNAMAEHPWERYGFGTMTVIMTLLALRLTGRED